MSASEETPTVDLHRHAETYAHLDRLIATPSNPPAYDWKKSVKRLAELPPGLPRVGRLNGYLDTAAPDAPAVNDV